MPAALMRTDLPFPVRSGKVRDVYDLGEQLLIVATDRISAFDCVMPNGIPSKGKILTALSMFWFDYFSDIANHLLPLDRDAPPPALRPFMQSLAGRTMLTRKAAVIPIECVARGYLAGSGWKEYQQTGEVCGVVSPAGLRQCDKLPEPIFTPASKEEAGHDVNISYDEAAGRVGADTAAWLRQTSLDLYRRAADFARQRGVIIADTKFEFGRLPDGRIILIDEILTPDSSRFWPADDYSPGREQASFDKQFVRSYLETLAWNKIPPAPPLPEEIVQGTRRRYVEAYEKITGCAWIE